MKSKKNYIKGLQLARYNIKELHFIKSSKEEIEERCKNAKQQYDFSDYKNGGYIKAWIEEGGRHRHLLYIASPEVIDFPKNSSYLLANTDNQIFNFMNLEEIEFSNINTSNVTNMNALFYELNYVKRLDLSMFDTSNVEDMSEMFSGCSELNELNLSSFNTKKVTNMNRMFFDMGMIEKLDLSMFDTSNVEDMSMLFSNCHNLEALNLETFDTRNVITMSEMFYECNKLKKLQLKNFDTRNVVDFDSIFSYMIDIKELDLSNFIANKEMCTAYGMFKGCYNLKKLDISQFEFGKVSNHDYVPRHRGFPIYYETFSSVPENIKIYVKNEEEKKKVITIGMTRLKEMNVIVKES